MAITIIYIIYNPRTQMTLVLIGKGLVLEGWPSKIEVSWVLGLYINRNIIIVSNCLFLSIFCFPPARWRKFEVTSSSPGCEEHCGCGIRPGIRHVQCCPARGGKEVTAIPNAAAGDVLGCQACGAQYIGVATHARLRKLLAQMEWMMYDLSILEVFESTVVWLQGHEGTT